MRSDVIGVESGKGSTESHAALAAELETVRRRLAVLEAERTAAAPGCWGGTRGVRAVALLLSAAALTGATMVLAQSAAEALFIDKDGRVGIGLSSPTQMLDVAGRVRAEGGFQFADGSVQTTAAVPAGAVLAFNLSTCPAGWTEYAPAYGRFIRGIDKSGKSIDADGVRKPGSAQEDAIRNITGSITGVSGASDQAWSWGFRPGRNGAVDVPYTLGKYNTYGGRDYEPQGGVGTVATFDASRVVPTSTENRPRNVALLYCQKS